ncbi:MAG TPA: hypothetical protein QGG32_05720 [Rhodospirillales bacterium]|nr:hypothetical protein [Rhodospirillales bacterium]
MAIRLRGIGGSRRYDDELTLIRPWLPTRDGNAWTCAPVVAGPSV